MDSAAAGRASPQLPVAAQPRSQGAWAGRPVAVAPHVQAAVASSVAQSLPAAPVSVNPLRHFDGRTPTAARAPASPVPAGKKAAAQGMMMDVSGGLGGSGGDGDKPRKWRPDDKAGFMLLMPRSKGAGGKHFIPANWIDRLFALAIQLAGNLGRVESIMSDIQDLIGEQAPLELSFYRLTKSSSDPYVSLTNSREKGFDQVLSSLRERLREWGRNIFSHKIPSSNDGGGRRLDLPDNPSGELANRLARAAAKLIIFFDKWIGRSNVAITFPLVGGDRNQTWLQMRYLIMLGMGEILIRGRR